MILALHKLQDTNAIRNTELGYSDYTADRALHHARSRVENETMAYVRKSLWSVRNNQTHTYWPAVSGKFVFALPFFDISQINSVTVDGTEIPTTEWRTYQYLIEVDTVKAKKSVVINFNHGQEYGPGDLWEPAIIWIAEMIRDQLGIKTHDDPIVSVSVGDVTTNYGLPAGKVQAQKKYFEALDKYRLPEVG